MTATRLILSKDTIRNNPELLSQFLRAIAEDKAFLKSSYPRFDSWVENKVIPGIGAGFRTVVLEKRLDNTSGLLILKHTDSEKKICTLRIRPDFEKRGLGVRLFELAFDILQTNKPLLSVSENTKPKFGRLFKYFGFSEEASYLGLYVPFREEHAFNGVLEPECSVVGCQYIKRPHRLPDFPANPQSLYSLVL